MNTAETHAATGGSTEARNVWLFVGSTVAGFAAWIFVGPLVLGFGFVASAAFGRSRSGAWPEVRTVVGVALIAASALFVFLALIQAGVAGSGTGSSSVGLLLTA